MRGAPLALALAVMAAVAACADEDPVSVNGDLIPLTPQTVEVILPWSEFGAEVEILGGFGTPSQLPGQVVSLDYRGELDSRALVRFFPFPASASVRDSTGTTRVDSAFTWLSGRVVARVDTLRTQVTGPVEMSLSRLDQDW
ncbi:MAG TPA: hypothetical protein VLA43_21060, partial [Longimicrobiales bacterium]|nr:hypothetical protein [Longimicrobiales bacterium]